MASLEVPTAIAANPLATARFAEDLTPHTVTYYRSIGLIPPLLIDEMVRFAKSNWPDFALAGTGKERIVFKNPSSDVVIKLSFATMQSDLHELHQIESWSECLKLEQAIYDLELQLRIKSSPKITAALEEFGISIPKVFGYRVFPYNAEISFLVEVQEKISRNERYFRRDEITAIVPRISRNGILLDWGDSRNFVEVGALNSGKVFYLDDIGLDPHVLKILSAEPIPKLELSANEFAELLKPREAAPQSTAQPLE